MGAWDQRGIAQWQESTGGQGGGQSKFLHCVHTYPFFCPYCPFFVLICPYLSRSTPKMTNPYEWIGNRWCRGRWRRTGGWRIGGPNLFILSIFQPYLYVFVHFCPFLSIFVCPFLSILSMSVNFRPNILSVLLNSGVSNYQNRPISTKIDLPSQLVKLLAQPHFSSTSAQCFMIRRQKAFAVESFTGWPSFRPPSNHQSRLKFVTQPSFHQLWPQPCPPIIPMLRKSKFTQTSPKIAQKLSRGRRLEGRGR